MAEELEQMEESHGKGFFGKVLGLSRKPWFCLMAAGAGVLIGLKSKHLAESMEPVGELYMTLLTMTVIPIIFSALASGINKLIISKDGKRYVGRIAATLLCGTLVAGLLGVFVGVIALPLLSSDQNRDFVGQTLSKFEDMGVNGIGTEPKEGFWGFISNFIPSNAFDALASDNLLAIVFLAGLLGIAMREVSEVKRTVALHFIDAVYETFLTILEWVLYLLPIGLCCLMASQVAKVGGEAIKAMLSIIVLYIACFGIMTAVYLTILVRSTGKPLKEVWHTLKETFTLAFVASADSALPIAMKNMGRFGYPKEMLSSAIPLSAAMNRHGTAIIFGLTTLFVADIYDVDLSNWQCLFLAVACAIVGAFDSGEYVTIAPMIVYVLAPMGLPPAAGVAVILTIWPMIEWLPELQCIMAACANSAIAGNLKPEDPQQSQS